MEVYDNREKCSKTSEGKGWEPSPTKLVEKKKGLSGRHDGQDTATFFDDL